MPVTTIPILSLNTTDQSHQASKEILHIAKTVATGAFREKSNFRIKQSNAVGGQSLIVLTTEAPIDRDTSLELAARLAESIIQLIALAARDLRIAIRGRFHPICRRLELTGLTWHFVRLRLIRMNAAAARSPTTIRLACEISASAIQITLGQPTVDTIRGCAYLCSSVVQVRVTPSGEVVRIRSGNREMSIAIAAQVSSNSISNGMSICTTPIAGLIQHRITGIEICQLSLL